MKDFIRHLLHIGAVAGAATAAVATQTGPITSEHVIYPTLVSFGLAIGHALLGDNK